MKKYLWLLGCLLSLTVCSESRAEPNAQGGGLIVPGDPYQIVICSYAWGECEFSIPWDQWQSTWQFYPCDALFALFECKVPSRKTIERRRGEEL